MLDINKIKEGFQVRKTINDATVQEYADYLTAGGKLPPIVVFFDKKDYWLADGWHRLKAHQKIECLTIQEEVHIGTKRDALKYALSANSNHGLPRTNADKRHAVTLALDDPDWSKLSDVKIAEICAVTQPFVLKVRHEKSGKIIVDQNSQAPITVIPPPQKSAQIHEVINSTPISLPEKQATAEEQGYTELDEARDKVADLQAMLAAGGMTREDAQGYVDSLIKEIKTLRATLSATESQRNSLMNENAELKRQCAMQAKKLKKVENAKTA